MASSPPKPSASPTVDDKESEGDTSKSSSSNQHKSSQHNEQSTSESREGASNSSISPTHYNYLKALQFSKPTSDSDDSTDGFPKYGPKRSDTLPNSYFSSLSTYGMNNSEMNLDSYSSDDDYKARLKVFGKGKSLLKKNVFKCSKRRSGDSRLKDSILSSYAEICYKCKLCKVSPCYMASVESFIFHMKNQHSDIYRDILLKPVTNGNCHPVEMTKTIDGSSSDDASCTSMGRITSEHLLKYSKLWQNSPKSSATDPKSTEETKASPSTSSSKPTTPVPPQIQKVTEQFLKSCDNLSLPGKQTNQSHIGGLNHTDRSKSTSTLVNTGKKSPSSPSTTSQNGWQCDLPPSFTPEFGRYTKLVREGGNIVYFCQVCNWKCQVKAAFGVHCNGQQHHTKARLADQNNFDKCKQKSEPNNVKAAIRKAIDYRDNLNKQQATNSSNVNSNNANSVKLPIINVPKVPTFNKVLSTESDSTKHLSKQGDINEKQNDIDKLEIRNKRKRPFPVRRTSADGDDWVDSESEEDSGSKRQRPDTIMEPLPKKVINPFLSHYPSMIPMDDYFSRYSAPTQHSIGSLLDNDDKVTKTDSENRDKEISLNLPLFPTGSTGLLPEPREENLDIQFRCTFCNVYCAGASDYKDHFRTEHDIDTPDLTMADGKGSQNNEWWKMMKIKESLPDTLISCPKGNVSRDLLLHKVSLTLNMPEVVRWGPSCNKAVREEFPNSLAQRKGKFKKTYFFGVSFIDQVQEQEEVSDSEMNYQPLRDMSNDLEKILEHLPALIHWTGNQVAGISRDDVLELLAQKMEEREIIHWGVQCNRAVRILFPDVQMKRKGKYKTTVFYGVDFVNQSDKQMIMRNSKLVESDKDDYLPVSFRDEDIKHSPYTINNPLLNYNPIAAQHNELALQYQSQLFNMWRFMSPFHPYPLQPSLGMMNLDNKSTLPKASNSLCSSPLNNHDVQSPRDGYESPVLSVGSKSDLDHYMGGNSKSPPTAEETGQNATNCSVEERKDREVNILSVSPLPVVSS